MYPCRIVLLCEETQTSPVKKLRKNKEFKYETYPRIPVKGDRIVLSDDLRLYSVEFVVMFPVNTDTEAAEIYITHDGSLSIY